MNRRHAALLLPAMAAGTALRAAESPEAAHNAKTFGAKGDGRADDTRAIQTALDRAGERGGVVLLPEGQYRVQDVLSVPQGVTLEGVWRGPHESHLNKGTTLLAFAGRDNENGAPFISLDTGSTLKGVTIFYPEQKVKNIHPYPWTIQGRGFHVNILDVTIANAYNGIDCGTLPLEMHHLRNVGICPLNKGIFIDQCTDIGRVENVHMHIRYWSRLVGEPYQLARGESALIREYQQSHLTGFLIGRTDWEYMANCFVIFAKVGFHFLRGKNGGGNVLITQSGSDIGPLAVKIDELQAHSGVAFENCQFMSGFEVGPDNQGPVKFSNCGFWGTAGAGSQMILRGRGTVALSNTHFHDWDQADQGKPCIQALSGSMLAQGCDFMGPKRKAPHVYLGKDLKSAALIGNRFEHGDIRIVNECPGAVQILGNLAQ